MTVRHHLPCENCGSSDALSQYTDHSYCFACNTTNRGSNNMTASQPIRAVNLTTGRTKPLIDRNISEATCTKYGVTVIDSDNVISKHIYPYTDKEGNHVANKIRILPKSFSAEGSMNNHLALFGQDKFSKGGKAITIFEGELDAMSGYELTGSLYPCVSIPNGSNSAVNSIKHNLEYLESFDKIVLCFDNDEPGKKAEAEVVPLFSLGKVRVMKLEFKDANEYLIARKHQEFVKKWWNASTWTPDGIVPSSSLMERIKNKKLVESVNYPWEGLNKLTYGIRKGELVTITADTGIGKSQFVREIIYNIIQQKPDAKIGTFFMEETPEDSAEGLMSIYANVPLHRPDSIFTEGLFNESFNRVLGNDSFYFYDSFGSNSIDNILNRVRYYVKGLDCEYVIIDHLSIIVSDQQQGDERKALDEIATKLKTLTIELGVGIIAVIHTNRQGQIRGTAGVEQLSNIILHLERDVKSHDNTIRNITTVTVWKNRFSGRTGLACYLKYDDVTGRMTETTKPEVWGE